MWRFVSLSLNLQDIEYHTYRSFHLDIGDDSPGTSHAVPSASKESRGTHSNGSRKIHHPDDGSCRYQVPVIEGTTGR